MMRKLSEPEQAYSEAAKTMNHEQFERIVKAILEGKYSWACVLILRFAGYNPAHYIPYRTYKRLIKENRQGQIVEQTSRGSVPQIDNSEKAECSFSRLYLGKWDY